MQAFKYLALITVTTFLSLSFVSLASAHSYVEESDPEDGSTSEEAIDTITLSFDAGIESATTATVIDEEGNEVELADETIEEGQEYIATLNEPLTSGDYTVEWQALGDDGHTTEGEVAFSVDADEVVEEDATEEENGTEEAGTVEEETTTTEEASEEEESAAAGGAEEGGGQAAGWMITAILGVIIAGALIFFISRSRKTT
ncbi:hypothetical protein HNR44_002782 [Geomicrobium halophilum]|uniref:CopC domain-containing protein n=1 Tax=Geomicrobium halophilum TaxID=549000 RepID=A0A841Q095_9BACL|nr:copper resistance protein CopC [Geomicrobium halophilum]MBB6450792.1 hypothetical protein [Geomicrobium halophilum]